MPMRLFPVYVFQILSETCSDYTTRGVEKMVCKRISFWIKAQPLPGPRLKSHKSFLCRIQQAPWNRIQSET